MFREMRRRAQQLSGEETLEILRNGKTGILGVIGDDGYPYTVPVNYVYCENKLYIHGAKSGHKLDAIARCDKVSLCVVEKDDIVAEKLTTYFKSVIVFGRARVLDSEEDTFRAAQLLGRKYSGDDAAVEKEVRQELGRLRCIEITIEHVTGKEAIELTRARREAGSK